MKYTKGSIFRYNFPQKKTKNKETSKVLNGSRMCVVLHKRETPYNTVLIAPVTRLVALQNWSTIPENYVKLIKNEYPTVLSEDSFINLDMTTAVDKEELDDEIKNGVFKITCKLHEGDLYNLDLRIAKTYELQKFLETEKNEEIKAIADYINHINYDIENNFINPENTYSEDAIYRKK